MDARDDRLFNAERFAAMKPGSMLVNVARGEIVDEEALADAIERGHLRGAALDVYVGEFEHPPPARLWSDPRVLITPHISSISDATTAMARSTSFATTCAPISTAGRCATSSTGSAGIRSGGVFKVRFNSSATGHCERSEAISGSSGRRRDCFGAALLAMTHDL